MLSSASMTPRRVSILYANAIINRLVVSQVAKGIGDKLYERRKHAALEIEQVGRMQD